ncbi:MAG: hypothetical protein Q9220_006763 [cf. Caloplaca sp. 1 TL-2023]
MEQEQLAETPQDFSTYAQAYWYKPDGSILRICNDDMLGMGASGLIVRHGNYALKFARISRSFPASEEEAFQEQYDNDLNYECVEREKAVYKRVGKSPGIAECVAISDEGITMTFYKRGDLQGYVAKNARPADPILKAWILSTIETVSHLHRCKILYDDYALRNMLLAGDGSLKMIDFSNCSLHSLDTDLSTVNDEGFTLQQEFFYLGCLIYSIATWKKFEVCLITTTGHHLLPLSDLPDLDGVLFGNIIRSCWTGAYRDVSQLHRDATLSYTSECCPTGDNQDQRRQCH